MVPYLFVLHDDCAQNSYIKMEKYSVISRKLITQFLIIFISVKTEFTIQFFIYEKVVRLWPHLLHRLLRPYFEGLFVVIKRLKTIGDHWKAFWVST